MEVKRALQAWPSLNAFAVPDRREHKPETLKVGEYYRIGNVHENYIRPERMSRLPFFEAEDPNGPRRQRTI